MTAHSPPLQWPPHHPTSAVQAGLLVSALLLCLGASAAPIATAPSGDLDQDGDLTVADLQCMILVFDRWATVSPLTDAWHITTLPGKSSGGAATLSAIAAAGDLLVTAHRHPETSADGDVITLYQAGVAEPVSWETLALHPDPGDLHADTLVVTPQLVAFYTQRSNVVSRVYIYHRAQDAWTIETLPTMYHGGTAAILALRAAGPRLYFLHRHPESGAAGDRVYRYDAATDALTITDTQDVVPGSADVDPRPRSPSCTTPRRCPGRRRRSRRGWRARPRRSRSSAAPPDTSWRSGATS